MADYSFPTLRASVTTISAGANAGDPASILIDGADTPITANGTPGYMPTPGDRLLVQQVGGQIEIVQFLSTGAVPRVTTYRQATLPDPALTPLFSTCYLTDSTGNTAGIYRLEQVAGVNTWVNMQHNASALNIADVRYNAVEAGFVMGGGGVGQLSNGPTAPTKAPTLATYYGYVHGSMWVGNTTDVSDSFAGLIPHPTDTTKYVGMIWDDPHGHIRTFNKSDLTRAVTPDIDANVATFFDFYPHGGLAYAGGYYYVLGSDYGRFGEVYIYKVNATTFVKTAELDLGPPGYAGGMGVAQLVSDGSNIGFVWTTSGGNLKLRWYNSSLVQVGTDITLYSNIPGGQQLIGGVMWGDLGTGLGANTLWVSMDNYGNNKNVMCWRNVTTTGATRTTSSDFPRASTLRNHALAYDSVSGRVVGLDVFGAMWTYSTIGALDGSSLTVTARYTFYDGDTGNYAGAVGSGTTIINGVDVSGTPSTAHETGYSPTATKTFPRRAFGWITLPILPPDVSLADASNLKPDKANRAGIYIAQGGGTMFRAIYTPAPTPAGAPVITDAQSQYVWEIFPTSGTPDVHTFATSQSALGVFQSVATKADGTPKFYVDGSGAMTAEGLIPAGTIVMTGANTNPPGWLTCKGTAVSRTAYPDLFNAIGTKFGLGDGTTTFNVPDFRGRLPYGVYGSGVVATNEGAYEGQPNGSTTPPGAPAEGRFDHRHTHGAGTGVSLQTNTTTGGTANRVSNAPATLWTDSQGVNAGNAQYHAYLGVNYLIKT